MARVAVILTNYNMPERADALFECFEQYVNWPHDFYLVDNGSDLVLPARNTTHYIERNRQTTGGWLYGLTCADTTAVMLGIRYFAYMFLITSAEYTAKNDILAPMAQHLIDDPFTAGIHPALTADSTTAWQHLYQQGNAPRRVPHIDNIASLYRADWFNSIGRFDPGLTHAHGVDLETCWKARRDGYDLMVHDGVQIKKVSDIGYEMGRMRMSADDRRRNAKLEMDRILGARYGLDYWNRLQTDYWIPDKKRERQIS